MHVARGGAGEGVGGVGLCGFLAVRALAQLVVGLAGGFGGAVGGEGAVCGGAAGGEGLDVEFGGRVVAD